MADPYEKFRESKQAAVKLDIALDQAFREDLPEAQKQAYRDYLRLRIRPAVQVCTDRENTELLEALEAQGWMDGISLEEFLAQAARDHKNGALIWLLRRKQETTGFSGPDLSL